MATPLIELLAPRDRDAEALARFHHAMADEVGLPDATTAEDVRYAWREPGFDREQHARVVLDGDAVIAAASVGHQGTRAWGGGGVLPEARGKGIGSTLIAWMIATARAMPEVQTLYTGSSTRRPDAIELIRAASFAHVRTFYRMVHPEPGSVTVPALPAGYTLDPLRGDALVAALVEAHNGSFIDHWDFSPWTAPDITHWVEGPDSDPTLIFIARGPQGDVAGLNWCELERGDGWTHGTVHVLGTTRPHRGIGLGSTLLRIGVHALAARGARRVALGVDSENLTGALGMYERAGFARDRENHTFALDVS